MVFHPIQFSSFLNFLKCSGAYFSIPELSCERIFELDKLHDFLIITADNNDRGAYFSIPELSCERIFELDKLHDFLIITADNND